MPYLETPRMLQVETTVKCNATCITCPNSFEVVQRRGEMSDAVLDAIIEEANDFPNLEEFHPFFTAEPLMDRRLFSIMDRVDADIHLYTNGQLLNERMARRLLDRENFKFIAFSLDGATKEVFEKVRPGLKYETVVANAERFLRLKSEMGREDVHVKTVMTSNMVNRGDIEPFKVMWNRPGVDEVMVHGSDGRAGMDNPARELASDGDDKVGAFQNDPRWPCRRHRCHEHSMYILSNGDVVPCCKDATGMTVIGNVATDGGLRAVWNSDRFGEIRAKLDAGLYDESACKACPFWG